MNLAVKNVVCHSIQTSVFWNIKQYSWLFLNSAKIMNHVLSSWLFYSSKSSFLSCYLWKNDQKCLNTREDVKWRIAFMVDMYWKFIHFFPEVHLIFPSHQYYLIVFFFSIKWLQRCIVNLLCLTCPGGKSVSIAKNHFDRIIKYRWLFL